MKPAPAQQTTATLERAAAILPEMEKDMKAMAEAITVAPAVTRRCIRSTGREFEEAWRCDADPDAAERAARSYAKGLDYMRSPSVKRLSASEFSVHWWGMD